MGLSQNYAQIMSSFRVYSFLTLIVQLPGTDRTAGYRGLPEINEQSSALANRATPPQILASRLLPPFLPCSFWRLFWCSRAFS